MAEEIHDNTAAPQNSTVIFTKVNQYMCPSDSYVGQTGLNNYHACYGTTTDWPSGLDTSPYTSMQNADGNGSTGMFAVWLSYGIANATDGTSNTLFFAEALVGDNKGNESAHGRGIGSSTPGSHYRGNGVVVNCRAAKLSSMTTASPVECLQHSGESPTARPAALRHGVQQTRPPRAHHQPPRVMGVGRRSPERFRLQRRPDPERPPLPLQRLPRPGQPQPAADNGSNSSPRHQHPPRRCQHPVRRTGACGSSRTRSPVQHLVEPWNQGRGRSHQL